MKFGKSNKASTSYLQTVIRDGLDKDVKQGEICLIEFTYNVAASVTLAVTPSNEQDVLSYFILITNSFICREEHFHAYDLATLEIARATGFSHSTFNNLVAHVCADIISTWFKDSGHEPI